MSERFIVLRGTTGGPVYLAQEGPFGAIRWTQDRDGAWRFTDQVEVADVQAYLVRHFGDAVAVVPDRVGPGPDRPLVHGEPTDLRWTHGSCAQGGHKTRGSLLTGYHS